MGIWDIFKPKKNITITQINDLKNKEIGVIKLRGQEHIFYTDNIEDYIMLLKRIDLVDIEKEYYSTYFKNYYPNKINIWRWLSKDNILDMSGENIKRLIIAIETIYLKYKTYENISEPILLKRNLEFLKPHIIYIETLVSMFHKSIKEKS